MPRVLNSCFLFTIFLRSKNIRSAFYAFNDLLSTLIRSVIEAVITYTICTYKKKKKTEVLAIYSGFFSIFIRKIGVFCWKEAG